MRYVFFILNLFLFNFLINAQSVEPTIRQEIPNLNIKSFAQDDQGMIWIGTENGLRSEERRVGKGWGRTW